MRELAELCAGRQPRTTHDGGEYSKALRTLHDSIASSGKELRRRTLPGYREGTYQTTPLIARKLLEECSTAILGRLDPIRLVAAHKGPKTADFQVGDRNASSINWNKDIISDFKTKNSDAVWSQATIQNGIVRALLDGHLGNYVFESSHSQVLDALQDFYSKHSVLPGSVIFLQKFNEGAHLRKELQKQARESYSCLSKGIHFEFFSQGTSRLSEAELRTAIGKSLAVISTSALYSHFTDFSTRALTQRSALVRFDTIARAFSPLRETAA